MNIFYIVYWPLAFLCDLYLLPIGPHPDTRGQVTRPVSPPGKPLRPTEAVLTLSGATSHLHKATPLTHTPGGQLDTPFCTWEAGVLLPSWPACATTAQGREGDRVRKGLRAAAQTVLRTRDSWCVVRAADAAPAQTAAAMSAGLRHP